MKNWKTTVAGLIGVLGFILPTFGIPLEVAHAIQTVGIFLTGFLAKDNSVSGTGM